MSLNKLSLDELLAAAEFFGTDLPEELPGNKTEARKVVRTALEVEGVDYAQYRKFLVPDEGVIKSTDMEPVVVEVVEEPVGKPVEATDPVEERTLVRMTRENRRFERYGYTWTKEHPFQLVDNELVDRLMTKYEGFRPATPKELQEYYS